MAQTLRPTNLKGWFECYREVCPICGHVGGCMINSEGDKVACIRQDSKVAFSKNSACPSWLHFLKDGKKVDAPKVDHIPQEKKKSPQTLNVVYKALLSQTSLDKEHLEHLTSEKRGLSVEQVITRQYRSKPAKSWNAVKNITRAYGMNNFKGIPGFYLHEKQNGQSFWNLHGAEGILIPFRNYKNQICGFQIRVDNPPNEAVIQSSGNYKVRMKQQPNVVQVIDEDGSIVFDDTMQVGEEREVDEGTTVKLKKGKRYFWLSSANKPNGTASGDPVPLHISVPSEQLDEWKTGVELKKDAVWLSEGGLKCDIASDLITKCYTQEELVEIGDTFIALPGVGSWRLALDVIKNLGAKRVNLAFDNDVLNNPYVKKHLKEASDTLRQEGIELYIALWHSDDGNGIDDCLLQRKRPLLKAL